ncbi:MAG: fumarate hydratase [Candidatus Omnitrophica bacterium]|nr:fumarate hydratase [Candidatus Omnitrophota bacterium]
MRVIAARTVRDAVERLVLEANTRLRPDVRAALQTAAAREKKKIGRAMLHAVAENARVAARERLAICQDTGLPVVFAEIGHRVAVAEPLVELIKRAAAAAYRRYFFRASIQPDPLRREKKMSYFPGVVHIDIVRGERLRLWLLPKGFGCENKSQLRMFNPTAPLAEVENFIVESVRSAGASACPPFVVGVGIGGTQDCAALLAKKSLLRRLNVRNRDQWLAGLEERLLRRINALGVGPFGFGGSTTALGVAVLEQPTHIAGLPVAVNISCHALRSAQAII